MSLWTKQQMISNYLGQPMDKKELQFVRQQRQQRPNRGTLKPCQIRNIVKQYDFQTMQLSDK